MPFSSKRLHEKQSTSDKVYWGTPVGTVEIQPLLRGMMQRAGQEQLHRRRDRSLPLKSSLCPILLLN